MKKAAFFLSVILLLAIMLTQPQNCIAKIPEPDNIFYGMAILNGKLLTAQSRARITLKIDPESEPIALYIMGDNAAAGDFYILRVPIYTRADDDPDVVQAGDEASIYINDVFATQITIANRGTIQMMNLDTSFQDTDGDGLSDNVEVEIGTNPDNPDTDNDGISDGDEYHIHGTNPLNTDTDDDGLSDGYEVNTSSTNPLNSDTDGDELPDGWEVANNLNPLINDALSDADSDGVTNLEEYQEGSDPQDPSIYPGAPELCDGADNDLDGSVDEEGAADCITYYRDEDKDDYGVDADSRCLCGPEGIYAANKGGDPDDLDPNVPVAEESFIVDLKEGWSMISLPVKPESLKVSDSFPDAVVVYRYEKGAGYVRLTSGENMEVGQGYWILLNADKNYTLTGRAIEDYSHSINADGWYIIGGCTYDADASVDNETIGVIYGYVPGIGYKRIQEPEKLTPGKGYWIMIKDIALAPATLQVETSNP